MTHHVIPFVALENQVAFPQMRVGDRQSTGPEGICSMFPVCLILFLPFPVFFGLNINITDFLYVSVLLASTSMHHLPGPKEDRSGHWIPGAELEMVMSQGRVSGSVDEPSLQGGTAVSVSRPRRLLTEMFTVATPVIHIL